MDDLIWGHVHRPTQKPNFIKRWWLRRKIMGNHRKRGKVKYDE